MKYVKPLLLTLGILAMLASFVIYLGQVTSCYPAPGVWAQFSQPQQDAFTEECHLKASALSRFATPLGLFVCGGLLFTLYGLWMKPAVRVRRSRRLTIALIGMMLICLGLVPYRLLAYPLPWDKSGLPSWIVGLTAAVGLLAYLGCLALWHWVRWGTVLFWCAAGVWLILLLLEAWFIPGVILALGGLNVTWSLRPFQRKFI